MFINNKYYNWVNACLLKYSIVNAFKHKYNKYNKDVTTFYSILFFITANWCN